MIGIKNSVLEEVIMKKSTKVLIGVGSAIVISSTVAAVLVSETVAEEIRSRRNRRHIKRFVNDRLDGNEQILNVVDDLSDSEIDSITSVLNKLKDAQSKITVYGENFKDLTEDVKSRILGFADEWTQTH